MNYNKNIDDLISNSVSLVNSDNLPEAESMLQKVLLHRDVLTPANWHLIAHLLLLLGKFDKAREAYIKADNLTGAAFASILIKDLTVAKNYLDKSQNSVAKKWCIFLFELFSDAKHMRNWPTYFGIRQFMEFTVYSLLLSGNVEQVKYLLFNISKLEKINSDSLKLIGYAYFHFGLLDDAIKLLSDSIKKDKFNGEADYTLAQIYLCKNMQDKALEMLESAKLLMPEHYATKVLIEKINLKTD